MLEVYNNNVVVGADVSIPFPSTHIQKGCTAVRYSTNTIALNKKGVYAVTLDGYVAGTVGGTVTIQLRKDGILQPQAITEVTADNATTYNHVGFTTLIQVNHDNSNCCCISPVILDFINSGIGLSAGHLNVTITRIC